MKGYCAPVATLRLSSSVSAEKQKGQFTIAANRWFPPHTHTHNPLLSLITWLWNGYCAFLCGCQRPEPQQHQSTFERLVRGGCAYSEVSVAKRDELSNAIACSIHHWIWGHGPESTDGGPLLRSPGSSDLIMHLYKLWRHRSDRDKARLGHQSLLLTSRNYSRGRTSNYHLFLFYYSRF